MTEKETRYRNPKFSLILPIIFAMVLAGGIYIGKSITAGKASTDFVFQSEPNKLDFVIDAVEKNYVDSVGGYKLVEDAIPLILQKLDPHSIYIPAKDLQQVSEPLEGNFEGIGVQFNILNDTLIVLNTISGGPSEKVGVLPGDKIITINDTVFSGTGISNEMVIKELKGKRGTKVVIGVARVGYPKLLSFEITRDKIPLYSVDVAYMLNNTTGYIKISAFARTTYDEFIQAIVNLKAKGMKNMVLDLRSNTGGYMDAAIKICDEILVDRDLIVYTEGRRRSREDYYATAGGQFEKGGLAVLIDSWSASASEIVAGAVQDNDRGTIIGRRSFGKGLVQETIYFRDGSAMRLTIARYHSPSGRCIQKSYSNGVVDYEMELSTRFKKGEFEKVDSTMFVDSLKYFTKNGRVVYGGGGIMPDIFVPLDTLGQNDFYRTIARKSLIYNYALTFTNQNRSKLSSFTDYQEIVSYLNSINIFDKFMAKVRVEGVKPKVSEVNEARELVKTYLYAFVCRNMLDNKGYYPVIKNIDKVLEKAIEELQ